MELSDEEAKAVYNAIERQRLVLTNLWKDHIELIKQLNEIKRDIKKLKENRQIDIDNLLSMNKNN